MFLIEKFEQMIPEKYIFLRTVREKLFDK